MKYIFALILALSMISVSFGASGSTSTGSTSTSTTISVKGAGGVTTLWNYRTSQYEMLPQCFPWIFASDYFVMNIANMYVNQDICRNQRSYDFYW